MAKISIDPISEASIKHIPQVEEDLNLDQLRKQVNEYIFPMLTKALELKSKAEQGQTTSRLYKQIDQSPEQILLQLKKLEENFDQLGSVIAGFKNKVCKTRNEIEKNSFVKSPSDTLAAASPEKNEKPKFNWLSRWFRPSKT
jgi:hypothetical protein